jgi:DNA polymerase III epsilon subunit-like protein
MIIVDVETTGVSPEKCSLLSIGAVELEHPENQFYGECRAWDGAHVEAAALEINGFTKDQISDPSRQNDQELIDKFLTWLLKREDHTLAGQNPSFDRDFLQETAMRCHVNWPVAHRTIDLHSIAYFHMSKRGVAIPKKKNRTDITADKIFEYVGIGTEPKPHNGLTGAKMEAEALSRLFYDKPLLPEFADKPIPWKA